MMEKTRLVALADSAEDEPGIYADAVVPATSN